MPSSYTQNYQLSQWEADDRVQRTDFNSDNAEIDAALAAFQTVLDGKGNCRAKFGFYMGGNEMNRVSIETDFPPKALLVSGYLAFAFLTKGAERQYVTYNNYGYQIIPTWTDMGVSWTDTGSSPAPAYFLSDSNTVYSYAVFG